MKTEDKNRIITTVIRLGCFIAAVLAGAYFVVGLMGFFMVILDVFTLPVSEISEVEAGMFIAFFIMFVIWTTGWTVYHAFKVYHKTKDENWLLKTRSFKELLA